MMREFKLLWPNNHTVALLQLLCNLGVTQAGVALLSSKAVLLTDGQAFSCLMRD